MLIAFYPKWSKLSSDSLNATALLIETVTQTRRFGNNNDSLVRNNFTWILTGARDIWVIIKKPRHFALSKSKNYGWNLLRKYSRFILWNFVLI